MRGILQKRIPPIYPAILGILALIFLGQKLQSQVHLNHDVSYFAHLSGWLLQGRSLGTDLLDGNLPMVWALFMPAAALVRTGVFTEPEAVRVVFWGYLVLSASLLICTLSWGSRDRAASFGWVFAFVLIATLAPAFSFGQREHACVLFAMPYLAAAALRLQGERPLRTSIAIAIGVLAGIGFSLKPYFLAIPALIELLLLVRLGWRTLFTRVESCALVCTVVAYVAVSALFFGEFLKTSIELTLATYWAYEVRDFHALFVQRVLPAAQPALFGTVVALATRTWSWQHAVVLVAGLGFAVSYFVQAKGFVYHAYPILVCSWIYLGICLGHGLPRARAVWAERGNSLRFFLLPAVVLLALLPMKQVHDDVLRWYVTYNIKSGSTGQFRQAVIEIVNHFSPNKGSYYFAFTTHPFPGFPTASYTNADWSGRMMLQSLIPAYARLDEVTDPALREQVMRAGEYQRRIVIEDFERRPPTVVFAERSQIRFGMNGRQFDDIAFYLGDPRFQKIWKDYEEYQPLGPLRVFVRRPLDPRRP